LWIQTSPKRGFFRKKGKGKNKMNRITRISLLSVSLVTGLSGFSAKANTPRTEAQEAPAMVAVKIDNFSFGPQSVSISAGTKVTWTNRDDIPHTVVSTEGLFKSHVLDTDESFSFTFDKPGTYPYFCSVHPKMTGQVVVK
jgi:plastocyanin